MYCIVQKGIRIGTFQEKKDAHDAFRYVTEGMVWELDGWVKYDG